MDEHFANLQRPRHPIPDFVIRALEERGLVDAYRARPAYQQNDYVGWISRAKREETRAKRLRQMLDELAAGGVYMKMKHAASAGRATEVAATTAQSPPSGTRSGR